MMRGCLSVLVLALAFVAIAIWFGGPPLASAVVRTTLTSSGFTADTLDVEVTSDPPLKLAVGRADRIAIMATGVRWNTLRLASLSLSLGSVDLVARTAATADGRLGGAQLNRADGEPIVGDVVVSGPADAARTTFSVDAPAVDAMAIAAFETTFGVRPSSATLAAPDLVRVKVGGLTISGRLSVAADGSIVVTANGATIRLLAPDPSLPVRLTALSVTPKGIELVGTIDVSSLLR
jgi:hypothetical protein